MGNRGNLQFNDAVYCKMGNADESEDAMLRSATIHKFHLQRIILYKYI